MYNPPIKRRMKYCQIGLFSSKRTVSYGPIKIPDLRHRRFAISQRRKRRVTDGHPIRVFGGNRRGADILKKIITAHIKDKGIGELYPSIGGGRVG